MEDMIERLTPAERQLKSVLMADYPFAGLEPIQELSRKAGVSAPSISRFVTKIGFSGFQEFQQKLVQELKQGNRSPIDLRDGQTAGQEASLLSYLQRIETLNSELAERVSPAQFDRVCQLLGDSKRRIYMIGGRMSDSIAGFFVRHLCQIRKDVFHIPADPETWPEYLLRLRPKDIVLVIDFRRYQASLERLSIQVRTCKAQTIVITDQWISPCAKGASELISVPIGSGTLWDSYVPAFALVEALLIPLAEMDWDATKARIAQWDEMRDEPTVGIGE
ncbi:MurR/RpiR family transcriptional regulator [Stappia sp. ES.058]|uniref:MurR/RpiR family transcriptional regulator n=1 Tax=Stappia sp. ES.058 TaxID=1881061 RepID=UPI001561009D|nr:MurR/RpiR family transcriptional regulator [Stappia sp. ES.058]